MIHTIWIIRYEFLPSNDLKRQPHFRNPRFFFSYVLSYPKNSSYHEFSESEVNYDEMIFKILDESNNPFTVLPFNSPMSSNKIGIIY